MGWITLSSRKQALIAEKNSLTFQDLQMSNQIRRLHRHTATEQSIFDNEEQIQLQDIKAQFMQAEADAQEKYDAEAAPVNGVSKTDIELANLKTDHLRVVAGIERDYEEERNRIQDEYDRKQERLEDETNDKELQLQQEKTKIEQQMEAVSGEIEALEESISNEIKNGAIKLS